MSENLTNNIPLQAVVDSLGATLLTVDTDGHIVSAEGKQWVGLGRIGQSPVGKHLRDAFPADLAERLGDAQRATLESGNSRTEQYRLPKGRGQTSSAADAGWYEVRIIPLAEPGARRTLWLLTDISERMRHKAELREATLIDPLTEVSNQRHFMRVLDQEVVRQERYRESFCLLLLELDHYDTIRDNYGAETADACLREAARLIRQQLRHSDVLGRLEDAEFGILLLNTPLNWAKEVAERIRSRIARTPITLKDKTLRLTVSGGVTPLRSGDTASSLLWRTEEALFNSERSGQSQISVV